MKLQLLRNATLKLSYGGRTILIDPYFAPRHSLPSFAGRSPNPLVDLPLPVEGILAGVELVVVSHLHSDHFDKAAQEAVPKHLPIVCQPGDEATIGKAGFTNVTPLTTSIDWNGLRLTRCEGSHGLGTVVEKMGNVMGFVLESPEEPTLYWAGDTVLYPPVLEAVRRITPDIIVSHSCGARWEAISSSWMRTRQSPCARSLPNRLLSPPTWKRSTMPRSIATISGARRRQKPFPRRA
jgi:L-ascorbate metabolism protein UlaG (beta-lactamase superfamily)